jgi:hypothetical protein
MFVRWAQAHTPFTLRLNVELCLRAGPFVMSLISDCSLGEVQVCDSAAGAGQLGVIVVLFF